MLLQEVVVFEVAVVLVVVAVLLLLLAGRAQEVHERLLKVGDLVDTCVESRVSVSLSVPGTAWHWHCKPRIQMLLGLDGV